MVEVTQITQLLSRARGGDAAALHDLLPLVYDELRALARRHARGATPTLNTTAIVHEAYLKVFGDGGPQLQDRAHFFAVACLAMRQVLRDYARRRRAEKRGGGAVHVSLHDGDAAVESDLESFLALDRALAKLQELSPRLADVVQLRYFAGLTVQEVASLREQTERTIWRDWLKARAFLAAELAEPR
jgi:RNA polymerase sigma factor (TIGR02999 family)